jgi:hypothetical protein
VEGGVLVNDSKLTQGKLPDRASLEFLKKRAKERLAELRQRDPRAKLAVYADRRPPDRGLGRR